MDPIDLERVEDRLADEEGEIPPGDIAYCIEGVIDASGRPALEVSLDGEVPLPCQRCLRAFDWPVHQQTTVLLAHDEQELAYLDDNDEREVLLAEAPLDPLEIVEDELLLTLPFVPRCERDDCAEVAATLDRAEAARPDSPSPFGALAALKRDGKPNE